jgi:[ribosomal protein S5]-alanine N-acetyltransferase
VSVLHTRRLLLREFTFEDEAFVLDLLNEPGFLRYIGDKGVRTLGEARQYLQKGPMDSYRRNGFGLYAVCIRAGGSAAPVGMCGLVKREGLTDPDIGFAFLERHWGQGYAAESAAAVLDQGTRVLKLPRIVAITSPDNLGSIRVLEKIGLKFDRLMRLTEDSKQVKLFGPAAAREFV